MRMKLHLRLILFPPVRRLLPAVQPCLEERVAQVMQWKFFQLFTPGVCSTQWVAQSIPRAYLDLQST